MLEEGDSRTVSATTDGSSSSSRERQSTSPPSTSPPPSSEFQDSLTEAATSHSTSSSSSSDKSSYSRRSSMMGSARIQPDEALLAELADDPVVQPTVEEVNNLLENIEDRVERVVQLAEELTKDGDEDDTEEERVDADDEDDGMDDEESSVIESGSLSETNEFLKELIDEMKKGMKKQNKKDTVAGPTAEVADEHDEASAGGLPNQTVSGRLVDLGVREIDTSSETSSHAETSKQEQTEDKTKVKRQCRICHSDTGERLIAPCECRGSMGLCHESCLTKWLLRRESIKCEVCFATYHCAPQYGAPRGANTNVRRVQNYILQKMVHAELARSRLFVCFWAVLYVILFNFRKKVLTILRYLFVAFAWGVAMPYAQYICLWKLRAAIAPMYSSSQSTFLDSLTATESLQQHAEDGLDGAVVGNSTMSGGGGRVSAMINDWQLQTVLPLGVVQAIELIGSFFIGSGFAIWSLGALFTAAGVILLVIEVVWFGWLMENAALLNELRLRPIQEEELQQEEVNRRRRERLERDLNQPRLGFGADVMDEEMVEDDAEDRGANQGPRPAQGPRPNINNAVPPPHQPPGHANDVINAHGENAADHRLVFDQQEDEGGDPPVNNIEENIRRAREQHERQRRINPDAPPPRVVIEVKTRQLPPPPPITQDQLITADEASRVFSIVKENLPDELKEENRPAVADDAGIAMLMGFKGDFVTSIVAWWAFLFYSKCQWDILIQAPIFVGQIALAIIPALWDASMDLLGGLEEGWTHLTQMDLPYFMLHTIVNLFEELTMAGTVFSVTMFKLRTRELAMAIGPLVGFKAQETQEMSPQVFHTDLTWAPTVARWYSNFESLLFWSENVSGGETATFSASSISDFLNRTVSNAVTTLFPSTVEASTANKPVVWFNGVITLYMVFSFAVWILRPYRRQSTEYWLKEKLVCIKQTIRVLLAHIIKLVVLPPILGVMVFALLSTEVEQGPPTAWFPWPRAVSVGRENPSGLNLFKNTTTDFLRNDTSSSPLSNGTNTSHVRSSRSPRKTFHREMVFPLDLVDGGYDSKALDKQPEKHKKFIFPLLVVSKAIREAIEEIYTMWYDLEQCPDVFRLPLVDAAGDLILDKDALWTRARLLGQMNSISTRRSLCTPKILSVSTSQEIVYNMSSCAPTSTGGEQEDKVHGIDELHRDDDAAVVTDFISSMRYTYTVLLALLIHHVPLYTDFITFLESHLVGGLAIIVVGRSLKAIFIRMDPSLVNMLWFDHPHQIEQNGIMFTYLMTSSKKYILTTLRTAALVGIAVVGILLPALRLLKDLDPGRFPLQYSIEIAILIVKAGVSTGWFAQGPVQAATVIDVFHGMLFGFLSEHLSLKRFFNSGRFPSAQDDFTFPVRLFLMGFIYWLALVFVSICLVVLPTFAGDFLLRALLAAENSETGLIQNNADGQPDADLANMVFFFSIDSIMLLSGALFICWTGGRILLQWIRRHVLHRIRLQALKRRFMAMKFTAYFGCELVPGKAMQIRGTDDIRWAINTARPVLHEFGLKFDELLKSCDKSDFRLLRLLSYFQQTKKAYDEKSTFYPPEGVSTKSPEYKVYIDEQVKRSALGGLKEEDIRHFVQMVTRAVPKRKRYMRVVQFVFFGIPLLTGFFLLLSVSMWSLVPPSVRNIQQCSIVDRIWYSSQNVSVWGALLTMSITNVVAFFFTSLVVVTTLPFSSGFWAHADKIRRDLMVHVMVRNIFGFNLRLVYKEICAPCMLLLFPLCFAPVVWDAYVYPYVLDFFTSSELISPSAAADRMLSFLEHTNTTLGDLLNDSYALLHGPPNGIVVESASHAAARAEEGSVAFSLNISNTPWPLAILLFLHHYQLDRFVILGLWIILVPNPGFFTKEKNPIWRRAKALRRGLTGMFRSGDDTGEDSGSDDDGPQGDTGGLAIAAASVVASTSRITPLPFVLPQKSPVPPAQAPPSLSEQPKKEEAAVKSSTPRENQHSGQTPSTEVATSAAETILPRSRDEGDSSPPTSVPPSQSPISLADKSKQTFSSAQEPQPPFSESTSSDPSTTGTQPHISGSGGQPTSSSESRDSAEKEALSSKGQEVNASSPQRNFSRYEGPEGEDEEAQDAPSLGNEPSDNERKTSPKEKVSPGGPAESREDSPIVAQTETSTGNLRKTKKRNSRQHSSSTLETLKSMVWGLFFRWVKTATKMAFADFEANTIVGIRIYSYGSVPLGSKGISEGSLDIKVKDQRQREEAAADEEDRMDFIA